MNEGVKGRTNKGINGQGREKAKERMIKRANEPGNQLSKKQRAK